MDISDRLREARARVGKTQEQVARDASMNITRYNGYERGRSRPAMATLERLAVALETTTAVLTGSKEHYEPSLGQPDRASVEASTIEMHFERFRSEVASLLGMPVDRVSVHLEFR